MHIIKAQMEVDCLTPHLESSGKNGSTIHVRCSTWVWQVAHSGVSNCEAIIESVLKWLTLLLLVGRVTLPSTYIVMALSIYNNRVLNWLIISLLAFWKVLQETFQAYTKQIGQNPVLTAKEV